MASASIVPTSPPVTLQISDGVLTGAKNVVVEGARYNVSFVDGTCAEVFSGCSTTNFSFRTEGSARAAAQALFDSVFVDGLEGSFDSLPWNVFGCAQSIDICEAQIPFFEEANSQFMRSAVARNGLENDPTYGDLLYTRIHQRHHDLSVLRGSTWAVFSLVEPSPGQVPEPGTFALLSLALLGFAVARRRATR